MSAFHSAFNSMIQLGAQQRALRSQIHGEWEDNWNQRKEYYINSFTNPETGKFLTAQQITQSPELSARAEEFLNDPHVNRVYFNNRKFLGMIPTDRGTYTMAVLGDDGKPAPVTATGATVNENPNDPILEGTPEQLEQLWGRIMDKTFSRVNSMDRLLTGVEGEKEFAMARAEMADILKGPQQQPSGATTFAAPDYVPNVASLGETSAQAPQAPQTPAPSTDGLDRGALYAAVQTAESSNNPKAVSPKGAAGLMQIMPKEMAVDPGYGVKNIFDRADEAGVFYPNRTPEAAKELLLKHPELNQQLGRDYLDAMLREHGGDLRKALAAYNWGPGNVQRHLREHGELKFHRLPQETRKYINRIEQSLGLTGDRAKDQVFAARDAALGRPEQAPTAQHIYGNAPRLSSLLPSRGTGEGSGFTPEQLNNASEGWLNKLGDSIKERSKQIGEVRNNRSSQANEVEAPKAATTDAEVVEQVALTTDRPQEQVTEEINKPVSEADPQVMQDTLMAETTRFESAPTPPTDRQLQASINAIYKQPTSKNFIRTLSIATAQGLLTPEQSVRMLDTGRDYAIKAMTAQANYDKLRAQEHAASVRAWRDQHANQQAQLKFERDLIDWHRKTTLEDRKLGMELERDLRNNAREIFTEALPQMLVGAGVEAQLNDKGTGVRKQIFAGMTPEGLVDALYNTMSQNQSQMYSDYGIDLREVKRRGHFTPDERMRLNYFVRVAANTWSVHRGRGTYNENVSVFPSAQSTVYRDKNGGTQTLHEARMRLQERERREISLIEVDAYLRQNGIHPVDLN